MGLAQAGAVARSGIDRMLRARPTEYPPDSVSKLVGGVRFRTWPVAAFGLAGLLFLIVLSILTLSRKAQDIYTKLDQLNTHHNNVTVKLRRLRSDVHLSGIFVRDYLLDISRDHAPEYRAQLAELRRTNMTTADELRMLDVGDAARIENLAEQLDDYWSTFDPLFDWTSSEKMFKSAGFLRREVVPRREAILAITRDVEELSNAILDEQRAEVARQQDGFRVDLQRLLWQTGLLGIIVAMATGIRLRVVERRSEEQRSLAENAERQTRLLSHRLVAAQEDERKNLSRELHDHVAQVLTALRMELGRIERTSPLAVARAGGAAAECRRLIDQLFKTVRDLALGLRPSMLDDLGLKPALEWHVRDFTQRYDIAVELSVSEDLDGLSEPHRLCIYRAVQEALTNCARHAHPTRVRVDVVRGEDQVTISVRDDGVGFHPAQRHDGMGLRGMEERVNELDGQVRMTSAPGQGTTLSIELPRPVEDGTERLARAAG
jgi:signal transduction histidine kinase